MISKINTLIFLKVFLIFLYMLTTIVIYNILLYEFQISDVGNKSLPKLLKDQRKTQKYPETNQKTNHEKLLKEREKVKGENFDEFVEQILKEIPFEEISIYSLEMKDKNHFEIEEIDKEIDSDFAQIIPGLGDQGFPVIMKLAFNQTMIEKMDKSTEIEGFNLELSKLVSPNRILLDSRPIECRSVIYPDLEKLPKMSIIIGFHNEPFSVLTRTIHSVVNRTPRPILKEILLVDDHSSNFDLIGGKLERYLIREFEYNFPGLIRLIRLKKRAGLIGMRLLGAHFATGDVLFFMDSHLEVGKNWAEPILVKISQNPKTLVVPILEKISHSDLSLWPVIKFVISGFNWDGWFNWILYDLKSHNKNILDSVQSPCMMGAAFGISRNFFWSIGSFDDGMKIWGAENLELPFRVWMCGNGSVETLICSKIGHINKLKHNYDGGDVTPTLFYNMARVTEVWLDEFKPLFYEQYPLVQNKSYGDISRRIALRKRLGCKSFRWFLQNIYPDKFTFNFEAKHSGRLKSIESGKCLDSSNMHISDCNFSPEQNNFQVFYLTQKNQLRIGENDCLTSNFWLRYKIEKTECSTNSDKWTYLNFPRNNSTVNVDFPIQIVHKKSGKCLSNWKLINCELEASHWTFIPFKR